jgi:hypothetical protein
LFIFVICEFGVGGGAYAMRTQIPGRLANQWMILDPADRSKIETSFGCCGWNNYTDNPGTACAEMYNNTIPAANDTHAVGCGSELIAYFKSSLYAVGTVAIVFATFQVLVISLGFLTSVVACRFDLCCSCVLLPPWRRNFTAYLTEL